MLKKGRQVSNSGSCRQARWPGAGRVIWVTSQLKFVQAHRSELRGPFLEVGSRDYGSTQDLRALFSGETYVGVDLSEGKSVDRIVDLTLPF